MLQGLDWDEGWALMGSQGGSLTEIGGFMTKVYLISQPHQAEHLPNHPQGKRRSRKAPQTPQDPPRASPNSRAAPPSPRTFK